VAAPLAPGMDGVARRQLQVLLLLDCSGSMQGDRIASLNYSIRTALPALRKAAEENPEIDVRLRALCFSTGTRWHIEQPTAMHDLQWSDIAAGGESDLGAALTLLATVLEDGAGPGRQLPPVIVLASDGMATDDYRAGLRRFLAVPAAKSAVRLGIAIGSDADRKLIAEFIADPRMSPLQASNASQLVEHIRWATTAPVKVSSSPSTGPDPLTALMQSADLTETADSNIVW